MNASRIQGFEASRRDPVLWGRIVETAVGARLLNGVTDGRLKLYYWRERDREVDFVLESSDRVLDIEVQSGVRTRPLAGTTAFTARFPGAKTMVVGGGDMELSEFFSLPITEIA